ncbi:MAG: HAD hydrolase family protein [bacterium]|nr:HAD hydrolase family protein [bacterium]
MLSLKRRCQKIKLFAMDIDGVMTEGSMILNSNGEDIKIFNVKDGVGIELLHHSGIKTAIITRELSKIVTIRAQKLKINYVYQGINNKLAAFNDLSNKNNLKYEEMAYIGDDLPDIPILNVAGLSICVKDSIPEAKKISHYITKKNGGQGAIRETVNLILESQGKLTSTINSYLSSFKE